MMQFFDSWTQMNKSRNARRALEGLSDRALQDIGIDRSDIANIVDRRLNSR